MRAFQILLATLFVGLLVYTAVVGINQGWNLIPVFFGDILALTWAGQFNLDFLCFLILSALWLSWRHRFTPGGFGLGLLGLFGGFMFLAPYLLVASVQANGDVKKLLLGKARAEC